MNRRVPTLAVLAIGSIGVCATRAVHAGQPLWGGEIDSGASKKGEPAKPTDPDTVARISGDELVKRGATTLADALDLLPEMYVREGGRGGYQADLQGAKMRSMLILVDGVPVAEPYYGNFDLSTIPVTDIAEIRVSLATASPLDGPGGQAGVIEVNTISALGAQRLGARAQASNMPEATASVTGRSEVARGFGIRVSGGGVLGGQQYDVLMPDGSTRGVSSGEKGGHAALRIERETDLGRIEANLSVHHRSFLPPPSTDMGAGILVVDGDDAAALALRGQTSQRGWLVRGRGFADYLSRQTSMFSDASLTNLTSRDSVTSNRQGFGLDATRALVDGVSLLTSAVFQSEHAALANAMGPQGGGRTSVGELATGVALHFGDFKIDGAAGLAYPLGKDVASPWPEAKLQVAWSPSRFVEFKTTGGRKGSLPTLREQYQLGIGNPLLGAEMATYVDGEIAVHPVPWIAVRGRGYVRDTHGLVKLDMTTGMLQNLGNITFRGVDAALEVVPKFPVGGGAAWIYMTDAMPGNPTPLDFEPHHRVDVWTSVHYKARVGSLVRFRYVGSRMDSGTVLASYATVDASAWLRFAKDLRATVRVDNLLDERYQERAIGVYSLGRLVLLSVDGTWE